MKRYPKMDPKTPRELVQLMFREDFDTMRDLVFEQFDAVVLDRGHFGRLGPYKLINEIEDALDEMLYDVGRPDSTSLDLVKRAAVAMAYLVCFCTRVTFNWRDDWEGLENPCKVRLNKPKEVEP